MYLTVDKMHLDDGRRRPSKVLDVEDIYCSSQRSARVTIKDGKWMLFYQNKDIDEAWIAEQNGC